MSEEKRKVYEGKKCYPCPNISRSAYCADCFATLNWEVHDPGDFSQKWIAFCRCNSNQRMWTMAIETVLLSSING